MKDCKHTNIVPVEINHHGLVAFRDECADCGCIMVPDFNNPVDGVIPFVALPMAEVVDLAAYRAKKLAKSQGVSNG